MKKIITISLLLLLLSCSLYISETTDSSYEDMLHFGLNRVEDSPIVVEDQGHQFSWVQLEEVEYSKWVSKETLSHNNRTIDTYISNTERCVLLVPSK